MTKMDDFRADLAEAIIAAEKVDEFLAQGEAEGNELQERIRELAEEGGTAAIIKHVDALMDEVYHRNRATLDNLNSMAAMING